MLIAGGTIAAISFAASAYYAGQFLASIESGDRHAIAPQGTYEVREAIEAGRGAYIVAFPDFDESVKASVEVRDPANAVIVQRDVDLPVFSGSFQAGSTGNYTLAVSNRSPDPIVAAAVIGEEAAVLQTLGSSFFSTAASFLLLAAGVVVLAAGVAVTILDGRREKKMRQFGDMSDLR